MSEWYLYEDDKVIGPYPPDQLVERIEQETLVCQAGSENWQKAGTIDELKPILDPESSPPSPGGDNLQAGESKQQTTRDNQTPTKQGRDDDGPAEEQTGVESEGDDEFENEELIKPTLENLRDICERAENEVLIDQYEQHWQSYDASERRIILDEIQNRGLLNENP